MKKLVLKLTLLLVVIAVVVFGCFGVPIYDVSMFSADGYFELAPPEDGSDLIGGRSIRYRATGRRGAPTILFAHGSPGSWENFARFLDDESLQRRARLIAIDRPGFGDSGPGKPERSLARQAEALVPALERAHLERSPVIVVGHSYGGPVAVRAAMDYPEYIDGIILVAPSIDPELEKLPWYQYVGAWRIVRWAVPDVLDVSNQEVLALKSELEDMLDRYAEVTVPVTVIQGEQDSLVHPDNADFAERMFTAAPLHMIRDPDANHFIPWTHDHLMRQAIDDHLNRLISGD